MMFNARVHPLLCPQEQDERNAILTTIMRHIPRLNHILSTIAKHLACTNEFVCFILITVDSHCKTLRYKILCPERYFSWGSHVMVSGTKSTSYKIPYQIYYTNDIRYYQTCGSQRVSYKVSLLYCHNQARETFIIVSEGIPLAGNICITQVTKQLGCIIQSACHSFQFFQNYCCYF